MTSVRGRPHLSSEIEKLDHPAADLLKYYRDEGVPVNMSDEPWDLQTKDACIKRGPHPSAKLHAAFVRDEMADFAEGGHWVVLPYRLVREQEELRLSPVAAKEERDRRPRILVDHTYHGVNDATIEHAPVEAMQFGGALPRILTKIHRADPRHGPVYLAKYDLSDGFYRMHLAPADMFKLATMLPLMEGEEQLVAIPLVCTMGWTNSPPTFSTMSETVCDVLNNNMYRRHAPPHRLEEAAAVPGQ